MTTLCIHVANVIYLGSFLARDILWLRALTCVGLVFGILFFTCQPEPLYGPTVWHVVFLGINLIQIGRLVRDRRQLALPAEQERVAQATFHDLSREDLVTLLTRSLCEHRTRLELRQTADQPLTSEECALRDIAFSRLTRGELLNLLTRRMWRALKRLNPVQWRGRVSRPPLRFRNAAGFPRMLR